MVGIGKAGDNRSQFVGRTGAGINGVGELGYTLWNGAKDIDGGPGNARRKQEGSALLQLPIPKGYFLPE